MTTKIRRFSFPFPRALTVACGVSLTLAAAGFVSPRHALAAADEVDELEEIVVTGSRIRRTGFDTLEPATVLTREAIDAQGLTNVADALNRLPGFSGGVSPDGAQASFVVGTNFVNRFNLGTHRTLTLVDGRRFVTSNPLAAVGGLSESGLQVDLNSIPTQLIERVENIAIGGAPTYGSDAIAGVVNVILRKNFEGFAASARYGISEEGLNGRYNVSGAYGLNFGPDSRGNVTLLASYDKVKGALATGRPSYARQWINTTNPTAAQAAVTPGRTPENDGRLLPTPFNGGPDDGIPNAVVIRDRRIFELTPGGLVLNPAGVYAAGSGNTVLNGFGPDNRTYIQFDRNGNLVPYNPGIGFAPSVASGGDGFNLAEHSQVTSGIERKNLSLNTRYGLTDWANFFFEGLYYKAESEELADQTPYQSNLFGTTSQPLLVSATHPLLTQQARDTLASLGLTEFWLGRASRDLYTNNTSATTQVRRFVFGFDGDFDFANRRFFWEAYGNMGRSWSDVHGMGLDQQFFVNAINNCDPANIVASYPGGGWAGGPSPVADPNCAPLDLFGEGRPSAAALAYVTYPTLVETVQKQSVYNVNLSSSLFDMWSGPLQYSVGFERRKESGDFRPDESLRTARGRSAAISPLGGEYTTKEVFGEVLIPLVDPSAGLPGLKKLELTGKYRRVDNEVNGKFDAYTYGAQWKPFHDLELRGNFTKSLRAPAIVELYIPVSPTFTFVIDPCDSRNIDGGTKPETRQANCAAFFSHYGITEPWTSVAQNATTQGSTGGNPNLLNESADSYTYGLTFAPRFWGLDGLVLAADYYNIDITGVIASLTANDIASGCFDNDSFDAANVPNANSFCGLLTRDSAGQITFVQSGYVNGSYRRLEAYTAEARYGFDTGAAGRFDFGISTYIPTKFYQSVTSIADTLYTHTGMAADNFQLSGNWRFRDIGAGLSLTHIPETWIVNPKAPESRETLTYGKYTQVNANVSYDLRQRGRVRLSITNLFDESAPWPLAGPVAASGTTPSSASYDTLGRSFIFAYEWQH